jgi:phosphoesterase RecJ-like protein
LSTSPESFLKLLASRERFLLTGHEHPDGDCLGSQVALFHLLESLGKQVTILNPDLAPRSLDFLGRHTPFGVFQSSLALPAVDVVVLLDCARLSRVGGLAPPIRASGATIAVVDHHVGSEEGDGDVAFVDPSAAATGALVHALFRSSGAALTPPAAEGIFVALTADTGWFRYSNTSAAVFEAAAEVTRAGVDPAWVFDQVHRRHDPDSVEVLAEGIGRSRIGLDGRLGLLAVERPMIDRATRCGLDLDALMEPLRSVSGMEVVAMFKEIDARRVKVSLRAQGDIDVQEIAKAFGGGGHRKAAGATLDTGLADAERAVTQAVERALVSHRPGSGVR